MVDRTQALELLIKAKDLASREIRQVNNEVGNLNRNLARGLGGRGGLLGGAAGAAGLAGRLGVAAMPQLTPLITGAQVAFSGLLTAVGWVGDGIKWMVDQAMVALKRLAVGAAAASAAIIGIGVSAIQAASVVQSAEIGFTTMTKSVDMAKELVASLQAFAAQTPFQFQSLLQIARPLMAFGFGARQIIPMLRDIGDAIGSLGGGTEGLERVVRAFGQVQAKGRIMMEEVLQFAEAGIPIFDILRTKLGLTEKQMQQLGRQGVSASIAIPAILEGLRERFGGGMAAQMATVAGKASNLADALFNLRAAAGRALLPVAGVFVDFAERAIGALQPLGEALSQALASPAVVGAVQGWMGQLAEWLGGKVAAAIDWLVTNGPKLGDAITTGIAKAIWAVQVGWAYLAQLKAAFLQLGSGVRDALTSAFGWVWDNLSEIVSTAILWIGKLAMAGITVAQVFVGIGTAIWGATGGLDAFIKLLTGNLAGAWDALKRWLTWPLTMFDNIMKLETLKADVHDWMGLRRETERTVPEWQKRMSDAWSNATSIPVLPAPAMAGGPSLGPTTFAGFTGAQMAGPNGFGTVNVTNNFNAPVIGVDDLEERIENGSYRAMRKAAGAGAYVGG